MSARLESIQNISGKKNLAKYATNSSNRYTLSQVYGMHVFTEETQKKYILKEAYESLTHALEYGEQIDERTADFVAVGLRNWAMDNGATHYTHWFHPLTGKTAEKHDSFFKLSGAMEAVENMTGKELIQQEPDASSFPHGGLRDTHQARGYTVWDPTSPPFIRDSKGGRTLCIPAIFISYTGESLDYKTPLMKSVHLIDQAAGEVARMFNPDVRKVIPTLGWEQEYFVVDEELFNARPDLVLCGRTLYGNASARGQQLDDHYFAQIPERVQEYMIDFENEALKLGIPLRTRHNEVAPTQFECAPHFETVNVSADHNQLLMDILDVIAKRHKLRVLLHEKPYNGINGSGKHNNWSMATDKGQNLLNPGTDPKNNLQFLSFFITVVKAVHSHGDLLRASIANVGNEYRLGANEAPPSIISIFMGDKIADALDKFSKNITEEEDFDSTTLNLNVTNISPIKLDKTDRNRTSPFPFTGDKFEFRAVGSSANVSTPNTVINVIVADQLIQFKRDVDELTENGTTRYEAIKKVLFKYLEESKDVIYNGDNYDEEWIKEAEVRGLSNIKSTPEALSVFMRPENVELFTKNGILTEEEIRARYLVSLEEYINKTDIESIVFYEIAHTMIIPAAVQYQNKMITNVNGLMDIGLRKEANSLKDLITQISDHVQIILGTLAELEKAKEEAKKKDNMYDVAMIYYTDVKKHFRTIRQHADKLELLVEDSLWPLPKYRELLFLH